MKGKEKKLKKILKNCLPLKGSIHNLSNFKNFIKVSSENPKCIYEMKQIKHEELQYLCQINVIKENSDHMRISYYSKLVENIITNSNF